MTDVAPSTHLRARPAQKRSAETFDKVLDAAMALLIDGGLMGFNTNAIAERAGVNVATVYHYFPDKFSVLRQLFEREEENRSRSVLALVRQADSSKTITEWVRDVVDLVLDQREMNGPNVLRRTMAIVPELQELDRDIDTRVMDALGTALRQRFPDASADRVDVVAMLIVRTMVPLFDAGQPENVSRDLFRAEVTTFISSYISSLGSRA
jgi:AcrR family transcriptional regulator